MSAALGRVPFISAGVVDRVFHPLRCVAEFTLGNKEITKLIPFNMEKMSGSWI